MVWKMVSVAVLAVVSGFGAANAQSAKDLGGPRELPPASYRGQQYVDSQGCVFLRAGFGGQTNWVPRVSRDRKQLCGYPPSLGGGQVAVAADPAPRAAAPAPRVARAPTPAPAPTVQPSGRKPIDTVASLTTPPRIRAAGVAPTQQVVVPGSTAPAPQKPVVAPPQSGKGAERVATTGGTAGKIGCYRDAPVAERFAVRGGGSVVMCTKGDGDLSHARAPRVLGGRAAVAPSGYIEGSNRAAAPSGQRVAISTQDRAQAPKGYKLAWEDDRLNPNRGKGTASGWADQDEVWTREHPARLVAEVGKKGTKKVVRKVYVSSKSEPTSGTRKVATAGRSYIQVGTFGQPSNADGASQRLAGLGLPVARSKITKGGKALQIVLAGPFASSADAQAALSKARRAGFSDAFIR